VSWLSVCGRGAYGGIPSSSTFGPRNWGPAMHCAGGHIPERWPEFLARYRSELQERPEHWEKMAALARDGPLTLLYSARDESRNNAVALRAFLLEQLRCGQD
jgi:hypothetical protein